MQQHSTKAWERIQRDITERLQNPVEGKRLSALRVNPEKEKRKVATRKQIAAARRNIKKAQAARKKKNPAPKRRTRSKAKRAAPKRRRRNAAPKRKATKRRVSRRRTPARRRSSNPTPTVVVKTVSASPARTTRKKAAPARRRRRTNPWYGQPRRHSKAAKKGWARRKRRGTAKRKTTSRKRKRPSKKRARECARVLARRRKNPELDAMMLANPAGGGLLPNAGPFAAESLKGYLAAASGVAFGLVFADFIDRFVATRTPSDTDAAKGVQPWYGRTAGAAIAKRPDAMRLGAQAGGAVVGILGTYYTRNMRSIIPWLLGGIAVGFGANLMQQVARWWVMPALLKVEPEDSTKPLLGNRLYPVEQAYVQDPLDQLFENWPSHLSAQQVEDPTGAIQSPLIGPAVQSPLLALGQPGGAGQRKSPNGAAANGNGELLMTGRIGACPKCGGVGGCYSTCPELSCATCPDGKVHGVNGYAPRCKYTVRPGDDFRQITGVAGIDPRVVNQLNGNQSPHQYWRPGNTVMLPYHMCRHMEGQSQQQTAAPSVANLGEAQQSGPAAVPSPEGNNGSPEKFILNFAADE